MPLPDPMQRRRNNDVEPSLPRQGLYGPFSQNAAERLDFSKFIEMYDFSQAPFVLPESKHRVVADLARPANAAAA